MDRRLLLLLHRASRSAVAHANAALARESHISVAQLATLSLMSTQPETTPSQIAKELGLYKSAVTSMLQRLERAGLIERAANFGDGRSTLLRLGARGRRVRTEAIPTFGQITAQLTRGFTDDEIDVVLRFLNVVVERCGSAIKTGERDD